MANEWFLFYNGEDDFEEIAYNVGFMAHNSKVAGSDDLKLHEGKFILSPQPMKTAVNKP